MLRWLEAFQGARNANIYSRLYSTVSGNVGVEYTDEYGRTIFYSNDLLLRTPSLVGSPTNTWVCGFAFRLNNGAVLNTSPSAFPHVGLRVSGGEQLRLEAVDASDSGKPGGTYYKMRVMRGATELARTVERFSGASTGTNDFFWTYFQWKATVRTGTNGSFELKYTTLKDHGTMNTATWDAAATGINTANQGSDGVDRLEIAFTTGDALDPVTFNDFYALDTSGSVNNDYLGMLYMEAMKPDGTGTTMSWTLAGSATDIEDALDEAANTQSTTEDDKRITSSTIGQVALATMSNLSSKFGTTPIVGVQVRVYGKMDSTGSRTVDFYYRKTTGTPAETSGGNQVFSSTAYAGAADTQETDPNTGVAWVLADLQAQQMGVKLSA